MKLQRVLIANRGAIARRLVAFYAEHGVESVVAFSEPEADQAYLDEADYDAYLNGRTVAETYMDRQRVLSVAMDAGCDALHPGTCFLAESIELYALAANANLGVIGADPNQVAEVVDRDALRRHAAEIGLPLIPGTSGLPPDEDGLAAAAQIGVPLFVKGSFGGYLERCDRLEEVVPAVARARAAASMEGVYLERAVDTMRQISTVVVADRHGVLVDLGHIDSSVQSNFMAWIEETGAVVSDALAVKLSESSRALAKRVGWVGVGRVRWAVTPDGGHYLLGFSARLTTGFDVSEMLHGVDLVHAQHLALLGEPLIWEQPGPPARHVIQVRLLHGDGRGRATEEGVLTELTVPDGVSADLGMDIGSKLTADTEPLLAKITAVGGDRAEALQKLRVALAGVIVVGVPTNLKALRMAVESEWFESGAIHTGVLGTS